MRVKRGIMKKNLAIGIMIIFLLLLCGCNTLELSNSLLQPSKIVDISNDIVLTVKEESIKSSKENITVVIENRSAKEYFYGVEFELEIEHDGKWYSVPFSENGAFIEIGLVLKGNYQVEEKVELSKYFSKLEEGKYRIVKTFYNDGVKSISVGIFNILK